MVGALRGRQPPSLRSALAAAFGLLTLALAGLLSLIVGENAARQLRTEIGEDLAEIAFQMADKLDRGLYERLQDVRDVAALETITEPAPPAAKREVLEQLRSGYADYAWIGLVDAAGTVVAATGRYLEGTNAASRPWFQGAMTGPFVGDVHETALLARLLPPRPDGEPIRFVDVAAPVVRGKRVVGVLNAHVRWAWAEEVRRSLLTPIRQRAAIDILVLNAEGMVILGPDELLGMRLDVPALRAMRAGERFGFRIARWADRETYVTGFSASQGYRSYAGLGWRILARQDADAALAPVDRLQQRILLFGSGAVLLFVGLGWFAAGWAAAPLHALAVAADRLRRQRSAPSLPQSRRYAEVTSLATSLDALVSALESEVAERQREAAARQESEARLQAVLDQMPLGLAIAEAPSGRLILHNEEAVRLLRHPLGAVDARAGEADHGPFHDDGRPYLPEDYPLARALLRGEVVRQEEMSYRRGDGTDTVFSVNAAPVYDPAGRITVAVTTFHDISDRKRAEERVRESALRDPLTGLANRTLLRDRLEQTLARARRAGCTAALLLLDLDRFKDVNDTLGHAAGDALLRDVAARLVGCVRASDTVARLGGDEFALLLDGLQNLDDAETVARKTVEAMAEPFLLDGQEARIGASVGVALCPTDGDTADRVLRRADLALYRVKTSGRGGHAFYDLDMAARVESRVSLERDLRRAIERGDEFELVYQPEIDLRSGAIRGAEALVRWRHPERGLIMPDAFVPIAEQTRLIVPLGQWVLQEACRQARRWRDQALPEVVIAVNVSLAQSQRGADLSAVAAAALDDAGLSPHALELEITESLFLGADDRAALAALQDLRDAGVCISVDDFGTGYSNLGQLRRLPVDKVKVDRSFMVGLGTDPDAEALVRAAVALVHALGLRATAEGIETEAQLALIRALGCDGAQGFLLGRPVPADVFAVLLLGGGHRWGAPVLAASA